MVICLERGADLHMAQLMPLPLMSLASVKSGLVLPFRYWLTQVVLDKGPLNGCVCVCAQLSAEAESEKQKKSVKWIGRPTGNMSRTHAHIQPFNSPLIMTTQASRYQKKPSPTHTHKEEEGFTQTTRSTT